MITCDDAGAGKTIMAGLYIREMLTRRLLRRILIVPPAGLVGNWRRELSTLFNLDFNIISGSDAAKTNPFMGNGSERLIVSVDTMTSNRVFARLQESNTQPYDLVVFDEAHKLSSSRGKDLRVTKTDRYRLAEALAGVETADPDQRLHWHTHHLLLLTATPHMGKEYPYYALWRLLEPDVLGTMEAFGRFPPDKRQMYFIRRTKEEMVHLDGTPLYPKRISDTLGFDLTQGDISEQRLYDETTEYLRNIYNRAQMLNQSAAQLAMGVFQRRLASSTYALLCSFERRKEKLENIISDVQQGKFSFEELLKMQRALSDSDDIFESKTADDESTDQDREENEIAEDKLLRGVVAASLADLEAEKDEVERLRELAQQVYDAGQESKFDRLREVITDKKFRDEKLIVFTEHKDTLQFLVRRLEGLGYTGQIAQIHGGMHYTEREEQVERFRMSVEEGGARFLVCTDAAGEGINLQFCWIMINYDVPWNPARLEQRMGRIHRYGQHHDPVIVLNLVAPSTREGKVLKTLLDKLEKIRKELKSDKVFDSIGRVFSDISIKQYMKRAMMGDADGIVAELDGRLTKEQVLALAAKEKQIYGDGGDVKKELPRLREDLGQETLYRLLPGYVRNFIQSAAPLVGMEIEGDLAKTFSLRPAKKGAVDTLLAALETYSESQRDHLTVVRPKDRKSSIWMHPGEPMFEQFRAIVNGKLGPDASRGAVFIDPTTTKPYLFHLAKLSVVRQADPEFTELAQPETIECRLVGVKQTEGSEITLCPIEHLMILKGGQGLPAEGQRLAVTAEKYKDQARAYLAERVGRSMAVEHRNKLLETLLEREAFIARGFDFQESELATARAKMSQKARGGSRAAATELARIKERQKELSSRREKAITVLRREPELIMHGDLEFIAHALVVPSSDPKDIEEFDVNTEKVAMQLAWAHAEASGATVVDVHTPDLARAAGLPDNPGFDLLIIPQSGDKIGVEVKGRLGTGEVEMKANEWAKACNLKENYWLYVVYDCGTANPRLLRIQDPFERLLAKNKGSMVIGAKQIIEVAETTMLEEA